MSVVLLSAKGVNGQLDLLDDRIRISRKGILAILSQRLKGEKEILLSQISSIQFKAAGLMTNGFIQFAFVGGQETKGGLFNATQDENPVMLNKGQQPQFEAMNSVINERRKSGSPSASSVDIPDQIRKLGEIREKGILTEQEFQTKKAELLARL